MVLEDLVLYGFSAQLHNRIVYFYQQCCCLECRMENCSWNDDTEWQELSLQKKNALPLNSVCDKTVLPLVVLSVLPCSMMIDMCILTDCTHTNSLTHSAWLDRDRQRPNDWAEHTPLKSENLLHCLNRSVDVMEIVMSDILQTVHYCTLTVLSSQTGHKPGPGPLALT